MDQIIKLLRKVRYIRAIIEPISLRVQYLKYKRILIKNNKYKEKYRGKRCFILGNGPSLKTQDLSSLKDEYTFAVNNFVISELFDQIKPTFYVITDSNFFDPEKATIYKTLLSIGDQKYKPICIFPVKKKEMLENIGLAQKLEIIYTLTEYDKRTMNVIDLSSWVPKSFNVVLNALYAAISMGFSEIYLLGVDMTGITAIYDETGIKKDGGHFFDGKRELDVHYKKLVNSRDNEFMLIVYSKVFAKFRLAKEYAQKHGIKIVNLTPRGALDIFPLGDLNSVLKKNETN